MAASKIQPNMGIWHLIAGIVIAVLGVYVWFNPAEIGRASCRERV